MSCFVMVKRKTRSRDCFGFANNIYEEALKELYNLSSYKRPFETLLSYKRPFETLLFICYYGWHSMHGGR